MALKFILFLCLVCLAYSQNNTTEGNQSQVNESGANQSQVNQSAGNQSFNESQYFYQGGIGELLLNYSQGFVYGLRTNYSQNSTCYNS